MAFEKVKLLAAEALQPILTSIAGDRAAAVAASVEASTAAGAAAESGKTAGEAAGRAEAAALATVFNAERAASVVGVSGVMAREAVQGRTPALVADFDNYGFGVKSGDLPMAPRGMPGFVAEARASKGWGFDASIGVREFAAGAPRRVYDPKAMRWGLLVEPARTNLCVRSVATAQNLDGWSTWGVARGTTGLSPMGLLPGIRLTTTNANGDARCYGGNTSVEAGKVYTYTFLMSPGNSRRARFGIMVSARSTLDVLFHPDNTITVSTYVHSLGQIEFIGAVHLGYDLWEVAVRITAANTEVVRPAMWTVSADPLIYVDWYGVQVEQAAFGTSFIVTAGSPVTRAADAPSLTVDWLGVADVRITYGDGTQEAQLGVTIGSGWWPVLAQNSVRSIMAYPAGQLA